MSKIETAVYNSWMDCWTKTRDPAAVHRVEAILEMLEQNSSHSPFHPDALSYSAAMQAWAKSGLPEAPRKIEGLLARMQDPRGKKRGVSPTSQCYEALMEAHARSSTGSARVLQILQILSVVEEKAKSGRVKLSPRTYAAALLALSQVPDADATKQAEAIITRMTDFGVAPSQHCYSLLITAYANDHRDKDGHRKALRVLDRMKVSGQTPNAHIYTALITAFANRGDSAMSKILWDEAQESVRDVYPLNAVLNAFRLTGTLEAAEEAESLFRSAVKTIHPDSATFSTVLSAWAQLGQVDRTMALFDYMKRDYPECSDVYAYTCAMEAYINSDDAIEAASHVERLFQEMKECGHRPSVVALTVVIKAYARNEKYREKAEALLKEMESTYRTTGDGAMKPPPEVYGYVARSSA